MKNLTLWCLFMLLSGVSCASSSTEPTDGKPIGSVEVALYSWRATWGPCRPHEIPCVEEIEVRMSDGNLNYSLRGQSRSAVLTAEDLAELEQFLVLPEVLELISEEEPCTEHPVHDGTEVITLRLEEESRELSKMVAGCISTAYESISKWNQRLRAYFDNE